MPSTPPRSDNDSFNAPRLVYDEAVAPLPPTAEAVLSRVFSDYGQVVLAQELGGGFTQSRVLVAQPIRAAGSNADLPLVLKIGPTWLIRQEQEGYTRFIRDKLPGRIELVTVELSDGWGVLGYRLAGDGQFKHESLAHYCRQTESDTLTAMLTGRLFKRLGTLWRNADLRPEPYPATKYDLLLPVRLVIEPQSLPSGISPTLLTPEQLTSDDLAYGDPVRLAGFVISEVDAGSREVTLDLPAEAGQSRSHRLRLQPVEAIERYRVGERLPAVEGRVTQTRRGRLRAEADQVLSSSTELELTNGQLRLAGGRVLPNPLAHLCALLSDWPAVKLAFQHGDLNLENILVDPATRDVTLIDFANAGVEHVLHDLLHLEMSVVTSLLAEALGEVGETPELIGPVFYDRLHQAATQDPALYTPPRLLQPALKKVYTILAAIRQTAQAYLSDPNDWGEYYRGLALYLVGALKFKDLDEVPAAPYPKQLALVGAAVAVELWQQPQVQPAPVDDLAAFTVDLQSAFAGSSEYDLSHKQLVLADGTRLLNPLAVLPDLLEPWVGTCLGRVHGRLELAELITELERQPADLIEAEVGQDERLHHLLRLETAVVAGLLPRALTEANQPPETIRFLFYERLHRALSGDPAHFALPKALPPALAKPYQLLAAIRRQAARFLTTDTDWATYYHGLALYLLGTLCFADSPPSISPPLGEERHPLPLGKGWGEGNNPLQPLIFLAEAITVDLWRKPQERPHPPTPYQGLHAFREQDAEFFFGRETFTKQLVQAVKSRSLVAVLGASGSGKSSVVFAGLVPALAAQGHWLCPTFRPGNDPFYALAEALVPLYTPDVDETDQLAQTGKLATYLREETIQLTNVFAKIQAHQPQPKLLLIADQFEEIYTLCRDADARQAFLDLLLAPIRIHNSQFTLVLTLRADFLGQALTYRPLADALQATDLKLGPMTREELQAAVEQPAARQGVRFEDKLVERILDDVGSQEGSLPLLEFCLTELWQRQSRGVLTHIAYEEIGQARGALSAHADDVYHRLTPGEQQQARRILIQLVHPGAGTVDTRRLATRTELEQDWPLVAKLASARLVVTNQVENRPDTVEVVHEALISHWAQLRAWMNEDRIFRAWQDRLRFALDLWQGSQHDQEALLRGTVLAEAEGWLTQRETDLRPVEHDFIRTSTALREKEQAEKEGQRQRELEGAQKLAEEAEARRRAESRRAEEQARAAKELRHRAIILAGVSILAIVVAIGAIFLWIEAVNQRNQATSRELAAIAVADLDVDPERSILLALVALDLAHTTQAEDVLHQALRTSRIEISFAGQDELYGLALSPDGTRLAAGGFDQQITIWNLDTRQAVTLTEGTDVSSVAFSPDGASLVAALGDGTASVWDVEARQKLFSVAGSEAQAMMAVFSPDGRKLAVSGADGTSKIWDAASGKKLVDLAGHLEIVYAIAFSPDSTRLATVSKDGTAKVWDASSGQELLSFCCHSNDTGSTGAFGVTFSPDGTRLATVGRDTLLKIWDLTKPDTPPRLFRDHVDTVFDVAFNLDGTQLATASYDRTAKVWDATSGEVLFTLAGHRDIVNRIAFSAGGQRLTTVSSDGTARVWNLGASRDLLTLDNHPDGALSVQFSPDGQMVATAGGDGTVTLWNATSGQSVMTMPHPSLVWRIAFSPDGQYLVAAQEDGRAMLWNLATKQATLVLAEHTAAIYDVAFSPDGRSIATASADGTAKVWQRTSGEVIKTLSGHTDLINSLNFSPDSRQLLTASDDGTAKVWNVETGQDFLILDGHVGWILDAAFSADGSRLATAGIDGRVIIHENTGQHLLTLLAHVGGAKSVAFSPDGTRLASAGADGTVKVWDPVSGEALLTLRGHTAQVYDLAFSPDGTRLASASADGQVRLYVLTLDELKTLARRRTTRSFTPDECLRYQHQLQCP